MITSSSTSLPPPGFSGVKQEWYQPVTYDVAKKKTAAVDFAVNGERIFNVVTGEPEVREIDGKTELFVPGLYVTDETLPALFEYSVAARHMKRIAKGTESFTNWWVDASGRIAVEFIYHEGRKEWELRCRKNERLTLAAKGSATVDLSQVLGFDASGQSVVVRFLENGNPVLKPMRLEDGSWGRKTGRILGGVRGHDDSNYIFLDAEMQAHWNAVLRAFPDERVVLVSSSDDFVKIIVQVFGEKDGFVYALFDWGSQRRVTQCCSPTIAAPL